MKIHKQIVLLLALSAGSIYAQRTPYTSEKYIGVSGGMTGSMVYFYPKVDQSFFRGQEYGIVYRYIGAKNLGLQVEANYTSRGWREKGSVFERQLNYIDVPFLSHFNFGDKFRVFLNIGPKLSYLVSQEITMGDNTGAPQHINPVNRKMEYGLLVGTGFYLKMKRQLLQIEARANYSAIDLYPNQPIDDFDYSNSLYASVNLSWMFQLK